MARAIEDYLADKEFLDALKKKADQQAQDLNEKIEAAKNPPDRLEEYTKIALERIKGRPLSYSLLKQFRKSPLHFIEYIISPFEPTPAMEFGNLVDCLVTESEKFNDKYYIAPNVENGRTNEGRAMKQAFEQFANGRTVISMEDFEKATNITEALYSNGAARYYLDRMYKGQAWVRWKHPDTGFELWGIQDWHSNPEDKDFFIADLKTAADASDDGFGRQSAKLDYFLQAAIYTKGWQYKAWKFPRFVNVVVETKQPYAVNVLQMDKDYMEFAQNELDMTLKTLQYCIDNKLWDRSYDLLRDDVVHYNTLQKPGYVRPKFG